MRIFNLFRRKAAFNASEAIKKLAQTCLSCTAYTNIRSKLYYDSIRGFYTVVFECAQREYETPDAPDERFLTVRRLERFRSENLPLLLESVIKYAEMPKAFTDSAVVELPEGVIMQVKKISRWPNAPKSRQTRW